MKITNVRLRQLEGTMKYPGTIWEERLRRPIDIYPKFKAQGADAFGGNRPIPLGNDRYKVTGIFVQIETDEGVSGIGPGGRGATAFYIDKQLKPLLIGQDPMAIELLWDQMYRNAILGRKGKSLNPIS